MKPSSQTKPTNSRKTTTPKPYLNLLTKLSKRKQLLILIAFTVGFASIGVYLLTRSQATTTTTRLGLHVTQEELNIWRDRWASGDSDSFVNTRINEEKSRVTANKNTFMNSSTALLWGWTEPLPTDSQGYIAVMSASSQRTSSARARDAAFYALASNDSVANRRAILEKLRDGYLHKQVDQPGIRLSLLQQEKPWGTGGKGTSYLNSTEPHFAVAHAMLTHAFAYDYFKVAVKQGLVGDMTSAQHQKILDWHDRWGYLSAWWLEDRANKRFVDWTNGDYRLTSAAQTACDGACNKTPLNYPPGSYFQNGQNGPQIYHLQETWHNRAMSLSRTAVVSSLLVNNTERREKTSRWLRDFITYGVWPEGFYVDIHRGSGDQQIGLGYLALQMSHFMTSADTLARAGYPEVYEVNTTEGALGTAGAPSSVNGNTESNKSALFVKRALARYGTNTWDRKNVAANDRFNWHTAQAGRRGMHDRYVVGNLYHKDSFISQIYRGQGGYPTWEITGNGIHDLNDSWAYPAPYLMWAGLEGKVWPYNPNGEGTTPTPTPPPPSPTPTPPPEPSPPPPAPSGAYPDQVLASNPAGYWRFSETSGTSLSDSSGNNRTGTAYNANLNVSGPLNLGSEIALNGPTNGSWISLGTPTTNTNLDAWTWELWVQADSTTAIASTPGLMGERTHEQGSLIRMVPATNGWQPQLRLFRKSDLSSASTNVGAATTPFGERIHLAVTVEGAQTNNPTIRLYKNGQQVFTKTDTNAALMPPYREQAIGIRDSGTTNTFFSGRIDEPAIYPTALTATQIKAHYDAATATTTEPEPEPTKPGDVNGDNKVDISDLSILLTNWNSTTFPNADLNNDGIVNISDLSILLSNWGK